MKGKKKGKEVKLTSKTEISLQRLAACARSPAKSIGESTNLFGSIVLASPESKTISQPKNVNKRKKET